MKVDWSEGLVRNDSPLKSEDRSCLLMKYVSRIEDLRTKAADKTINVY
jgi:hypothetical protein